MPKKPKTTAAAQPESVKPSETRPAINERKLRELMKSARRAHADTAEINGGLGSEIKQAVENNHLHRKAFRLIVQLDRMEPEKLADFIDCFDHYFDISGLADRAKQVASLPLQEETIEGEHDASTRSENVKAFPPPSGVAAE